MYDNWKLILVIVVSVSIWIPVGQLKRRAQESLQRLIAVEATKDTKLSGFAQTISNLMKQNLGL